MLSETNKTIIRNAYKRIGENLENFTPRKQQTFMIAEISKTLAGEYSKDRKIITIEAGTGTGKSLAYSLGAIPLALSRGLKVCISTATVALQEQLVEKDLPFMQQHSGLNLKFELVKGRQRYVCGQKLAQLCDAIEDDSPQADFSFAEKPKATDIKQIKALNQAYLDKKWNGELDSWHQPISPQIWQQIQSDKHSCLRHLAGHQDCPFHQARDNIEQADVLVINHSLLLADLSLGGGIILPEPANCYYVIDEAHHLPQITRDHASASIHIKGAIDWLEKLPKLADSISALVKSQQLIKPALSLADLTTDLANELKAVVKFIQANSNVYFAKEQQYRFEHGVVPEVLLRHSENAADMAKKSLSHLNKIYTFLVEAVKDNSVSLAKAEPLLAEAGFMLNRLENLQQLWQMYAKQDNPKAPPLARWLTQLEQKRTDYAISASPIEVGFMLQDTLWSQCEGAVLCSATLCALNSFDHFRMQAGLDAHDGSQYQKVSSPFDYPNKAQLIIANMQYEPTQDAFTDEIAKKLPKLLENNQASLVLFSSYWQMQQVAKTLFQKHKSLNILVQGEHPRQYIISQHKKRIDQNKPSIIFGTQSFSEGLDLPGKYLTLVVITKLPFSVPTSPVDQAHNEYISAKGGNPFMSLTVPDASKKLVQACGRLLRNEKDSGKVVLLDKRVITKRYGQQLLDSLPPFKRIIE